MSRLSCYNLLMTALLYYWGYFIANALCIGYERPPGVVFTITVYIILLIIVVVSISIVIVIHNSVLDHCYDRFIIVIHNAYIIIIIDEIVINLFSIVGRL